MRFYVDGTKIFAVLYLVFANLISVSAQSDSIYRLPAGTKIYLRMDSEISSKVSSVNDTFTTTVSRPLSIRKAVVLPAGTIVEGRIVQVSSAAIGGHNGEMKVRFETINFDNSQKRKIDGHLVNEITVTSSQTFNILSVLGGTALGAVAGAVSKADKGALIGAGIGAGVGTGIAIFRKGKDVRIRTDEEFEIELGREVILPVRDY